VEPTGRPDAAGLAAFAEGLRQTFTRMTEQAPALHAQARRVQVTETSDDGLVTVTVGARGELVQLDIDPRVYRRPDSRQLADTIVATVQRAAAQAQARVLDIFEPIVPREQMKAQLDGDLDAVAEHFDAQLPR
jgi:DNA-binding protein YbaB